MSLAHSPQFATRKLFARPVAQYVFAVVAVATAFAGELLLMPTGTGAPFVLFFGAVLVSSILAGYLAGIVATLASIPLCIDDIRVLAEHDPSVALAQSVLYGVACAGAVYLAYLGARAHLARQEAEQVNAQLRESEERFRLTLDEAPIGMSLNTLEGRFIRVNHALCRLLGYSADELLQMKFQDVTHPDEREHEEVMREQMARGDADRLVFEKRYVRKDGATVTVLLGLSMLKARDGTPLHFIAQMTDITESKRIEESLRLSEAKFSGIISISSEAILSIDEQQRITLFNDGAERIFGYARSEVIGAPLSTLIPERFRADHPRHVANFMAGPAQTRQMRSREVELLGLRKNGEEFPVEAAISKLQVGDSLMMTAVLHDMTEQRRVEREQRALAEAGKILSLSLDYEETLTRVGELVVRELAHWCVLELAESKAQPRRLRVTSADQRLHGLVERLERLQLDPDLPHVAESVWRTGQPLLLQHVEQGDLERLAQSDIHLELMTAMEPRSAMLLPLSIRGRTLGVLMLVLSRGERTYSARDLPFAMAIADRAALAIENGRLYQAAVQATRLRDQVLAVVAHDLRNPLSLIQLQAGMLEPPPDMPERRNPKPRAAILRATTRMNRLIEDLLDVSQIEAGQLSIERAPVSASRLLEDFVDSERRLAITASLDLQLELEREIPEVWGDRDRISQVLENITGNSIKFTPPGGHITVGARPRGDEVLFWVRDTGSGIAAESLGHIFDRFWQVEKGLRRGAGLGLPISRGIVEAHGGRIWAESSPGHGTTFFFTIPRAPTGGAAHRVHTRYRASS